MTIILQLLIVAVAIGMGVHAGVPPYKHYLEVMAEASETLKKNVLSMDGNIPFLDDYRRDYAEILHVINYHGIMDSYCLRGIYYEEYQKFLAISAPEALTNPEKVVTEIQDLIDEVHDKTTEIKDLIDACNLEQHMCDKLVHDTVNENKDQYGRQADILIAAGRVADELNASNKNFEKVSKDLKAHQYVCTSPKDLKSIVEKVSGLHRVLHPIYPPVPPC